MLNENSILTHFILRVEINIVEVEKVKLQNEEKRQIDINKCCAFFLHFLLTLEGPSGQICLISKFNTRY